MTDVTKPVLVTGGAGYIGSVLTEQILHSGGRVRVLDRFSFGGASLLPFVNHPNLEIVAGDICDCSMVRQAMQGVRAVIHLAAIVGDPACAKFPQEATAINRDGSQIVFEAARSAGVRRFVFASTCSNYGKMADHDGFVDESSSLRPISLYAEQKVEFESFLLSRTEATVEPVCLRFATAYGLSGRPRFDLTVNEFTRELSLGRTLQVFGEQFWRPYCHVIDLARACRLAVDADATVVRNQAINVGETSENYQKKRLVEMICAAVGSDAGRVEFVTRKEDPRDYRVDFSKINRLFNFTVQKRVPDGIDEIRRAISSRLIANPDDRSYSNL